MKMFKNKERKQIFLSALLFVIIIALYIELNVLISKLNLPRYDITENKVYSISSDTKKKIESINQDVKIVLVGFEDYENNVYLYDTLEVVNEFEKASDKITIEMYEDESNENNPYILIESGNISRKIWVSELYQSKYNSIYENQEELFFIEPIITNSIMELLNISNDKLYICIDKSIYDATAYTSLVNIASIIGMDTYALNLSEDLSIPEDCKCLVITTPLVSINDDGTIAMSDFSDEEKDAIINYINRGGNILFLHDSKSLINVETPNLDNIMSLYGVSISDGIVCQSDNILQDNSAYIVPDINTDNDVYKTIKNESRVCFLYAGAININNDEQLEVKYQPLITANSSAFLRKDISNSSINRAEDDTDASGDIIGLYTEKKVGENTSKAIIYSNSVIATNDPVPLMDTIRNKNISVEAILLDNNSDMIADSIKKLMDRPDALYNAKSKYNYVPSKNILTDGITLKIIFIIPMIIIFIGYIVWRHRKNKK